MYFSDYETLRLPCGYPLARGKRNGNYISVDGRLGEAPSYTHPGASNENDLCQDT
jgi:hypothetical protein